MVWGGRWIFALDVVGVIADGVGVATPGLVIGAGFGIAAGRGLGRTLAAGMDAVKRLPIQNHHFATNKNSRYTNEFKKITDKYDLNLNGDWNVGRLPHRGRHPNDYHDFVLREMQKADAATAGDVKKFLDLFNENVVEPVTKNPELLRKSGWTCE